MARLVIISKNVNLPPHELGESWATIGRADGNTFQVVEASISGRHCEVRLQGDELLVRDLLSTNGTFIGGQKISEGVVKAGQTLGLGDVELRFENSAPTNPPGTTFISKMLLKHTSSPSTPPSAPLADKLAVEEKSTKSEPVINADKKFHVLFVDDSLAFIELFGGLCSEFAKQTWEIHSATSADRALQILQTGPVDLVVLDIGMPMLDGLQLLGIIVRRYPGLKVAVMTGKVTEARRADALAGGAELFLEKPVTADGMKSVFNMLNDLVSWAHLEGFTGALRHVGLQEVIQMECNGRHSSVLEIRNAELRGQVFIEAGAITHAAVGMLTGEQAFYRLMSLRGGEFAVKPFKAPPQRTIEARWEFLLMDAARASDEETVLLKKPLATGPAAEEKSGHIAVGEDLVVIPDSSETK